MCGSSFQALLLAFSRGSDYKGCTLILQESCATAFASTQKTMNAALAALRAALQEESSGALQDALAFAMLLDMQSGNAKAQRLKDMLRAKLLRKHTFP